MQKLFTTGQGVFAHKTGAVVKAGQPAVELFPGRFRPPHHAQAREQLEPVDARHHHVEDEQVECVRLDCPERLLAAAGDRDVLEAGGAQDGPHHLDEFGLVVDEQDALLEQVSLELHEGVSVRHRSTHPFRSNISTRPNRRIRAVSGGARLLRLGAAPSHHRR